MNKALNTLIRIAVQLLCVVSFVGCKVDESPKEMVHRISPTALNRIATNTLLETPTIIHLANTAQSALSLTATPPYIHYAPDEKSNIHLTFEYPSSWVFNSDTSDKDYMSLWFGDSRFLTLATPAPDDYHPTPNDFSRIEITVLSVEPDQPLDNLVEPYKKAAKSMNWIKILSDHKMTLDGAEAQVVEYETDFTELYTSVMFERDIFFVVKDQFYQITLQIAKSERGSKFEKDYDSLINSLRIVP